MADRKITVYGGASERVDCEYGEPFASLPTSFCLISPTSGGKTQQLLNIFCKFYVKKSGKSLFSRIFLFSPTARLDEQYQPLIKLIEKFSDQDREPLIFQEFSMSKLGQIIDEQRQIVEQCRKRKIDSPQIANILDDLAERADILQTQRRRVRREPRPFTRRLRATQPDHVGHLRAEDVHDLPRHHGAGPLPPRGSSEVATRDRRPRGRAFGPGGLQRRRAGAAGLRHRGALLIPLRPPRRKVPTRHVLAALREATRSGRGR